ncbi:MAG: MASE3 domain-containing protein [Sulfuricurvum sp.]|nr:MASE3 domain-containing protein [Sulfuricurvum sp.]
MIRYDLNGLVLPVILIVLLIAIRIYHGYLLFHVMVELFAVIVGILIAIISYYMHKFSRNDFLLALGVGFFWTAVLDLFHMLSYHGMNVYPEVISANPSTTLWIFARLLQIATLLAAPFIRFDRVSPHMLFTGVGLLTVILYFGTFMGLFPVMHVQNTGITNTKIALEYFVIFGSMVAMLIYKWTRRDYHPFMYHTIMAALFFNVIAESCFTLYVDLYGITNVLGHIFKFIAYLMIFRGIVVTALKEPFAVMSKRSTAYDAIPVPVVIVDNNGIVRQINHMANQYKSNQDDIVGQGNHELFHPNLNADVCPICQAIDKKIFNTLEVEWEDKYEQYTISPIIVDGIVTGTLQISIDISAQRQAEKQLHKKATLLKTIINTIPVRLFWKNKDSVYLGCNNLFAEDAGLTNSDQIIGMHDHQFYWHDQANLYHKDDKYVMENGMSKINSVEPQDRGNGETAWLSTSKVPLYDENGDVIGVVGAYIDITNIRLAQLKLKESEEFYRVIFSSVHEAILILTDNTISDCNNLALSLFELDRESMIGMDIFSSTFSIECRDEDLSHHIKLSAQGQYTQTQCTLILQTKVIKIVEISISGSGDFSDNKLIMVARDITKKIELEKLFTMQTRQAQMGEMISIIAHQWRQPLAIINAITSQMRLKQLMNGEEDSPEYQNLIKVEEQSTHLSQTISEYRDFFKPDKPKEYFNFSLLMRHALNLLDHTLKNHGIIIEEVILNDPKLFSFRNEILQVLTALLKNSLDAFQDNDCKNGKIVLTLDSDDTYSILSIHDNAGGISNENMNKLFIPYFTTKSKHGGTGLGLYMSKMIIHEHCEGVLEMSSQDTETIFTIKIPHQVRK